MRLSFHGGVRSVTGSNYLIESGDTRALVDCGLHQGSYVCEVDNYDKFPYDPASIDVLFVTHAHIDHVGRIPKFYREGFRGKIFSTPPTKEFAEELLLDSMDLLKREAKRCQKKPIYEAADVEGAMGLWKTEGYHRRIVVKDMTAEFYDAGHILGSSSVMLEAEGKKIIFSGDLGNSPASLIKGFEEVKGADYAVMESTYGNRLHQDVLERRSLLEDVIEDTLKKGGALVIPAFAMERAQELLSELNELVENGRIPRVPVFLDSPLAIKLTAIYKKYERDSQYFNQESLRSVRGGDAVFQFPGLQMVLKTKDSRHIKDVPNPKIIIAGSGMSQGGRIVYHEKAYLPDERSTILFVGYQAQNSLGRRILDGEKSVEIMDELVPVRASVRSIDGYSAHADQNLLLKWLKSMKYGLKALYLVHGEEDQTTPLAQKIGDFMAINTVIPEVGETVVL
ncbi:MAG: MBL fold metallo-hydrolase [Candidatus Colwellbacteria bacterium]|nr:MBL fold metallo-hydrolase [Candidatus Colwellbacteria bacterium]